MEIVSQDLWLKESFTFCAVDNHSVDVTKRHQQNCVCCERHEELGFNVTINWIYITQFRNDIRQMSITTNDKNKWTVKIYPGEFDGKKKFVSVAFCFDSNLSNMPALLTLDDPNGKQSYVQIFKPGEVWGVREYLERSKKDKTSLKLTIGIFACESSLILFPGLEDLTNVLYTKKPDVVLHGDNWEYQAHKEVLSARSPVFLAMFNHELSETNTGKIKITDIEPAIVQILLTYMYTGEPSQKSNYSYTKLYLAAEKYELNQLKLFLQKKICLDLNVENIFEGVALADLTGNEAIAEGCSKFILKNFDMLSLKEEWKELKSKNVTLTSTIQLLMSKTKM